MSKAKYEDGCAGCAPAAIDMRTKQALPPEHPMAIAILVAWAKANRKTKKCWHAVTCTNSRHPTDMRVVAAFRESMEYEIKLAHSRSGGLVNRDPKTFS